VDEVKGGEAATEACGHGLTVVKAGMGGPVGVVDVCMAAVVVVNVGIDHVMKEAWEICGPGLSGDGRGVSSVIWRYRGIEFTYLKSARKGPTEVDTAMSESMPLPIMRDVIVGKYSRRILSTR
jgi:hypothetical protein